MSLDLASAGGAAADVAWAGWSSAGAFGIVARPRAQMAALRAPSPPPAAPAAILERVRRLDASLGIAARFSADDRADVVQDVTIALVTKGALGRLERPGGEDAYVRVMLKNLYVSRLRERERQRRRESTVRAEAEEAVRLADSPEDPAPLDDEGEAARAARRLAAVRHQTAAAAAEAIARRAPRYRAAAARTWAQLCELVFEGVPFERILERDEAAGPDASRAARRAAEQRLYKAHQRLREEMLAAIDAAQAGGRLTADEAGLRRQCMRWLYRNGAQGAALPRR